MAKHSLSFRELLSARWETKKVVNALTQLQNALPVDMELPAECKRVLNKARCAMRDFDSIKTDWLNESNRKQWEAEDKLLNTGIGMDF